MMILASVLHQIYFGAKKTYRPEQIPACVVIGAEPTALFPFSALGVDLFLFVYGCGVAVTLGAPFQIS
jgi:hypothetical protein